MRIHRPTTPFECVVLFVDLRVLRDLHSPQLSMVTKHTTNHNGHKGCYEIF
jgi:hypothetical protein